MKPIHWSEKGDGFPLLLLHGFCETHRIWDGFSDELAKDFRVITPDLPGFGQSALPSQPFSVADIADRLILWLSQTHISKAVVIGHSLGGYITLAMAKKNPDLFSGIGLFHSTPFPDSEEKKANRNKTIDFVRSNGITPFVEVFVPGLYHQMQHNSQSLVREIALSTPVETLVAYSIAMRDRPSYEDYLRGCLLNTLILSGTNDSVVPISVSEKAAELAPHTSYMPLKNAGHMGMFENKSDALKAIRAFMTLCRSEEG